ncbi:hypothetical protein E4U42_005019 [Claviceps africana]|uniref:Uncharacterized protein n=1 Tax=Claviceps africana TaxID=83212 RepID=A0A8K0NFT8_9HYPO|nr:hypothetical protein E4U42_005019 [Claviceps africana]
MSVFAPGDLQNLVQTGLASPPDSEDGTVRVHKRRLNRSSDSEESYIPLSPSSLSSGDSHADIPQVLDSFATIKYLGFTEEKASSLWSSWTRERQDYDRDLGIIPFIELIIGHVEPNHEDDAWTDDDEEWYRFMASHGINQELQAAIMDPRFKEVRLRASCFYWIKDTLETRYLGLEDIQQASYERVRALQRHRQRPEGSRSGQPPVADEPAPTVTSEAAAEAANAIPGFTTLFRGMSTARMDHLRSSGDSPVNALDFQKSHESGSDFVPRNNVGIFFSVDREIAVLYALYAKRRHKDHSACLVQIRVPNSAIESLSHEQLQRIYWDPTGNDKTWEKVVFNCRQRTTLPREFRSRFSQAILLIGTIARRPNHFYQRLDSYEQITPNEVMRNADGRPAVQYVWCHQEGSYFVEDFCLEGPQTFPVSRQELAQYRREGDDGQNEE